jgi:GT2 family glycosyltransferase
MDLSIIIVSWNVRDMLADCLRSIEQYHGTLDIETIVIDSASSDGTVEMVKVAFPNVTLIPQTQNVGFVRGNNIGLAVATGRHLMLLNPDTQVHAHALQKLVSLLDEQSDVGIVGPHTLNPDGSHQSTRRRFPSILTGMFESTWLQRIVPLNSFYVRDLPDAGTFDVDWVQGSALMTRREVYVQIGGLDELYVMYFEELDFCKRAKKSGWRVLYVGDAYITHHGGGSTDQVQTQKHVHFQTSKLRYFRKFHGLPVSLLIRLVLIANYGFQVLIEGAKLMRGHKPELRRERIKSYAAVLRALMGLFGGKRWQN